jgi:hypothetical protein
MSHVGREAQEFNMSWNALTKAKLMLDGDGSSANHVSVLFQEARLNYAQVIPFFVWFLSLLDITSLIFFIN